MAAKKKSVANKSSGDRVDFESALEQLEALVTKLEAGDISLEESLQAFEAGVKLTRECQQQLNEAEQRVQVLMREQDELVAVDFDADDAFGEDDED